MAEKAGIKETKELMLGLEKLILLMLSRFKDGVGIDDMGVIMAAVFTNHEFRDAINGISNLKKEFSDLDAGEVVELVTISAQMVPKILATLKA